MGRPSKYNPEYAEQVVKLCRLGATDKELADFFGISTQTLNTWKKQYPKFLDSLKKGKILSDAHVADSLYHRAIGYQHPEDKIFLYEGQPVIVPTTKHYPPDTGAMAIWLKNRRSQDWRDKPTSSEEGDPLSDPDPDV